MDSIPVSKVTKFESELLNFIEFKYSSILDSIRTNKQIDADTESELKKAIEDFKVSFEA